MRAGHIVNPERRQHDLLDRCSGISESTRASAGERNGGRADLVVSIGPRSEHNVAPQRSCVIQVLEEVRASLLSSHANRFKENSGEWGCSLAAKRRETAGNHLEQAVLRVLAAAISGPVGLCSQSQGSRAGNDG